LVGCLHLFQLVLAVITLQWRVTLYRMYSVGCLHLQLVLAVITSKWRGTLYRMYSVGCLNQTLPQDRLVQYIAALAGYIYICTYKLKQAILYLPRMSMLGRREPWWFLAMNSIFAKGLDVTKGFQRIRRYQRIRKE
jgi:hypothetical protein